MSFVQDNNSKKEDPKDSKGRSYREYGKLRYTVIGTMEKVFRPTKDGKPGRSVELDLAQARYPLRVAVINMQGGVYAVVKAVTQEGVEP